jgi:putative endonuclease
MYYLYILVSEASGKYYIGVTEDFNRRIVEHNTTDRNTYTSKNRPWKIAVVFECGSNFGEARRIENFIKRQKSKILLEKMINDELLTGSLAHLVRVPHERY